MSTPKVRWRLFAEEDEPTTRERGANVYRELRRQGWDADRWNLHERADVIVLQYNSRDIEAALAAARVVVLDINDMVFADGHAYRAEMLRDIPRVQAVVAGAPRLAEHLGKMHSTVRMIEQAVGPQYWTVTPKEHTGLHLFWMGMHDCTIYFSEIDPVLEALAQRHEFTVHSCTSAKSGLDHGDGFGRDNVARIAAKPYPTEFHEWSVDGALDVMARCDVGVAPLLQNEWCRCKCANKAVNMMAAGLPVVVSDVPAYRAAIENGVAGRICYTPGEWSTALDELITNPQERKRMGKAGKESAKRYTVDIIARQWAEFFEEVAG